MKIYSRIVPYVLHFKFDAGTSRGVLREKNTWFWVLEDESGRRGIGECGPLKGLSVDDRPDFEKRLEALSSQLAGAELPDRIEEVFGFAERYCPEELPSARFGLETALLDLLQGGRRLIFDTPFYAGREELPINGLIWMGSREFMLEQIKAKLEAGFDTIKMKIGAIGFEEECELLGYIRRHFSEEVITLRVDANGAFSANEAMDKLEKLASFGLHSIEQPIRAGQPEEMYRLCRKTPVPIALDEELIGLAGEEKAELLDAIAPQFIILKPTLVGGMASSREWIRLAEDRNIGWWLTSALESNIGLNAICQFCSSLHTRMPQGLGTGQLYTNNVDSPLAVECGKVKYCPELLWGDFGVY
ncbi:MAG: o-succinylbenzoate synthase [Cytophagales bacterium]|nr:o-succinylbenzoate synthase [Cytophagales bacterium]